MREDKTTMKGDAGPEGSMVLDLSTDGNLD